MATKSRLLSRLIEGDGNIKTTQFDSDAIGTSAAKSVTAAAGTTIYSSADTLPASADAGDQAFVSSTNRLYIYNGSGWYNIALINSTPYWSSEASASYDLNIDGTSTTITLLAVDSEGVPITYTAVTDSDFDNIATITKDSDNGRTFIITPSDSENGTTISGTGTVTFRASDGVNLVSTLSTFSISFNIANSNYTTLLIKADTSETDDQVDASSNANTITQVGTVDSTALSPYHPGGYSTYFDGAGDNITISDLAMGSGDCTFEFWMHQNIAQSATYRCMLAASTYGSGIPFTIYTYDSNVQVWLSSGGTSEISGAFTSSTWHHIALVRNSGTWTLYIDGTSAGTSTTGGSYDFAGTTDWRFGENHSGSYDWQGYIKDARFVNGTAVYTSAFTPPTEPLTAIANTSLLTCHLPYIADGSSNDHTVTIVGNTTTKRFGPYNYSSYSKSTDGGSVYVGGATSYLSTNLPAMTGDWTIEGWIQHTANTGLSFQNRIFGGATNDPMILNTGLTSLSVYIDNNLKITANAAANTAAGINRWYHMALVRETTGNTLKLYINGKLAGSQSSGTYDIDAKDPFGIGSDANNSAYGMTGYIADFRVVNGTAVYTAEFAPPTEPLTEIANTDLLTATNKNDIWDAGSGSRVNEVGNATSSNTQRQFTSSSAIYFDGSGDLISVQDDIQLRDGDFTIEAWVYCTNLANDSTLMTIISQRDDPYTYWRLGIINGTGAVSFKTDTTNQILLETGSIPVNQWRHIAVTRSGDTARLFINGDLQATDVTAAKDLNYSGVPIRIGSAESTPNYFWEGYMQDVRVTKGLARYTSNFTPPTAEFDG